MAFFTDVNNNKYDVDDVHNVSKEEIMYNDGESGFLYYAHTTLRTLEISFPVYEFLLNKGIKKE